MNDRRGITTTLSDKLIKRTRAYAALEGKLLNDFIEEGMRRVVKDRSEKMKGLKEDD